MSVDPEALAYTAVDARVLEALADSYRRGLDERLGERRVEPTEELPRLTFVGRTIDPEPWTVLETSQGTHWYVGRSLADDELTDEAYEFGRNEADDHWF